MLDALHLDDSVRKLRFLCLAPHPDDAELGMGGTLIKLAKQGHYVHICELTNGEPTPNGSVEIRMKEAAAAAKVMGVERTILTLKNREVTHDIRSRHLIAAEIRKHKPDVLFIPYYPDAHPDHRAAHHLGYDARFDAKLTKSDIPGEPHHPARVIQYYCTHLKKAFDPTFCIDVSDTFEQKIEACNCYESQGVGKEGGLGDYVRTLHGYFGGRLGVKYAEPFFTDEVLGFSGLAELVCVPGQGG
ncbi:MAG: PIG-L family deacetylase [Planctomycetota bacterium]